MGKQDVVTYENEVDKLCGKFVVDVSKELKRCHDTVIKRCNLLQKDIIGIKVPQGMDEKELEKIPDRVNQILKEDSTHIKDAVVLNLNLVVDTKKKRVKPGGWSMSGALNGIL